VFERYAVRTSVVAWDDKHILLAQVFFRGEVEMASALVKARFLKKSGGSVATEELLALAGITQPSPVVPDSLKNW
jgi:hypothetical protein